MKYLYSPSTKGFYDPAMPYNSLPDDTIVLSKEEYDHIFQTLSKCEKEIIVVDKKIVLSEPSLNQTWGSIRRKRNKLLLDSDYKVMPDYPSDKEAWSTYRQQLRDITKLFSDPNEVIWPTQPK
jgi:hypothetical protein